MDFPKMKAVNGLTTILKFSLTSTTNRLTFDIEFQADEIRFSRGIVGSAYHSVRSSGYYYFIASNDVEIISHSRMDIKTGSIWLMGVEPNTRSGTVVFSSNAKRDEFRSQVIEAIREFVSYVAGSSSGVHMQHSKCGEYNAFTFKLYPRQDAPRPSRTRHL